MTLHFNRGDRVKLSGSEEIMRIEDTLGDYAAVWFMDSFNRIRRGAFHLSYLTKL